MEQGDALSELHVRFIKVRHEEALQFTESGGAHGLWVYLCQPRWCMCEQSARVNFTTSVHRILNLMPRWTRWCYLYHSCSYTLLLLSRQAAYTKFIISWYCCWENYATKNTFQRYLEELHKNLLWKDPSMRSCTNSFFKKMSFLFRSISTRLSFLLLIVKSDSSTEMDLNSMLKTSEWSFKVMKKLWYSAGYKEAFSDERGFLDSMI